MNTRNNDLYAEKLQSQPWTQLHYTCWCCENAPSYALSVISKARMTFAWQNSPTSPPAHSSARNTVPQFALFLAHFALCAFDISSRPSKLWNRQNFRHEDWGVCYLEVAKWAFPLRTPQVIRKDWRWRIKLKGHCEEVAILSQVTLDAPNNKVPFEQQLMEPFKHNLITSKIFPIYAQASVNVGNFTCRRSLADALYPRTTRPDCRDDIASCPKNRSSRLHRWSLALSEGLTGTFHANVHWKIHHDRMKCNE